MDSLITTMYQNNFIRVIWHSVAVDLLIYGAVSERIDSPFLMTVAFMASVSLAQPDLIVTDMIVLSAKSLRVVQKSQ